MPVISSFVFLKNNDFLFGSGVFNRSKIVESFWKATELSKDSIQDSFMTKVAATDKDLQELSATVVYFNSRPFSAKIVDRVVIETLY